MEIQARREAASCLNQTRRIDWRNRCRSRHADANLLSVIFEEQMGRAMDAAFFDGLANFSGRLFTAGLAPAARQ